MRIHALLVSLPTRSRPLAPRAALAAGTGDAPSATTPSLQAAQAWRPGSSVISGTAANMRITETYHALDQAMSTYLGTPAVPNWMTFGKYASRLAGEQIVRLEETLKVARRVDHDALIDTLQDFIAHRDALGPQSVALFKASGRNPFTFLRNAERMRDALVIGNTEVYADIVPAYRLFLQAEGRGADGVQALREAGYGRAPRDPQALLLPAFELYQKAAREHKTLSPEARRALIHQANLLIVTHEQWTVVQSPRVFGDPVVARLMGAFGQDLSVVDARGAMPLLPQGGDWTDFATRMGYQRVPAGTPGALRLVDSAGQAHHYRLNPDAAARPGTISRYFEEALGSEDARLMINAVPAALPVAFNDGSDVLNFFRRLGERVSEGLRGLLRPETRALRTARLS